MEDESGLLSSVVGYAESDIGDDYLLSTTVTYDNTTTALGLLARGDIELGYGYALSFDPTTSYFNLTKQTSTTTSSSLASHYLSNVTISADDSLKIVFEVNGSTLIGKLYDSSNNLLDTISVSDASYATGVVGTWAQKVSGSIKGTWSNLSITPALDAGEYTQFGAVALDQFGDDMMTQPTFTWSATSGTIDSDDGLYTASGASGTPTISAYGDGHWGSTTIAVVNQAPTVVLAASASDSPVTGTTTTLSVSGTDDADESHLTYHWELSEASESAGLYASFSPNDSNGTQETVATFSSAGEYEFIVTITDEGGLTATSTVTVTVEQTATTLTINPTFANLDVGDTQQFTVTSCKDQFDDDMETTPEYTWSATAGTINDTGYFTAPNSSQPVTVTIESGDASASASVSVNNSSPSTGLRIGDGETVSYLTSALGSPNGLGATHLGWLSGTSSIVVDTDFTVSLSSTAAPGSFEPNTQGNYSSAVPTQTTTTTPTWTVGGVTYTASDTETYTSSIVATLSGDDWTYSETVTYTFSVTVSVGGQQYSTSSGSYGYTFTASGDDDTSTYTCTVTSGVSGSGTYSDSLLDTALTGTWTQTTLTNTDTVTNTTNLTSGVATAARSGSGTTSASYSAANSYSYSEDGGSMSGSATASGSNTTSAHFALSYSNPYGYGWTTSGSASNVVTRSRDSSYSGSGSYGSSGTGWTNSGAQSESGGTHSSTTYTTYYSWSGNAWSQSSGSGTETSNGGAYASYSGGGTYSAAYDGASVTGTLTDFGDDSLEYNFVTYYTWNYGSWTESSGTGSTTLAGNETINHSYGGTTSDGTFGGGELDESSYSFTVNSANSGAGWTYTGTGSVSGNAHATDDFDETIDLDLSGTGYTYDGTLIISEMDESDYGYLVNYTLSGGNWQETTGLSTYTLDSTVTTIYSANGSYSASGWGWTSSCTFDAHETDFAHMELSLTSTDNAGTWTTTGSATYYEEDLANDTYHGSQSYDTFGDGYTYHCSGTFDGMDFSSYICDANYAYSGGQWTTNEGSSATLSSSGSNTSSYTGTGRYWSYSASAANVGTYHDSGSCTTTYDYSASSTYSSGAWANSGSGSVSVTGDDHYNYSGRGVYRRNNLDGGNEGWVKGTTHESGSGSDSYHYTSYYSLSGSAWSQTSGSGSSSGNYEDHSSYDGSGSYYRINTYSSDVNRYQIHGTVEENGSTSGSGNYSTISNWSGGAWATTGSGSSSEDRSYGYSYAGAGELSITSSSGDEYWGQSSQFHSTASESGSASVSQHSETNWSLSGNSWASNTASSWSSGSSQEGYTYEANYSGMSWSGNSESTTISQYSDRSQIYREFGSNFDGSSSTSWSSASGSGKATSDSFTHGHEVINPDVYDTYSERHTIDSWSKPSASGSNTVYGHDNYNFMNYYNSVCNYQYTYNQQYGEDATLTTSNEGFYTNTTYTGYVAKPYYGSTDDLPGIGTPPICVSSAGSSMLMMAMASYESETSFTYDESGNLASLTDPADNTTTWTYDENDQLTTETDALDNSRYYAYDEDGQLTRYTDANGAVRTYDYDAAGNVTQETWYANAADADLEQNPLDTIVYTYDEAGRMLSETDDTSSIAYTYNDDGLVTSVTESSDLLPTVVYAYAYNDADLVASVTVTIGGTSDYVDEYSYDADGNLTAISRHGVTGGNAVADIDVTLSYNELGQVASITRYEDDELVVTADYVYDADGLLVGLVYHQGDTILAQYSFSGIAWDVTASLEVVAPDGQSILPTYDTTGVVDALSEDSSTGTLLTTVTSSDGTVTYTYDALGQLLSADYSNASLTDESYTYDANGNRITANGSTYTTGLDNQLLSDGTYTYAYDAEGNRTERFIDADADGILDAGDTDATVYEWDVRNRLVEVADYATYATFSGNLPSQVVDYFYDVENRWIGETIDSDGDGVIDQTIGYSYDGDQITLQFKKTGSGPMNPSHLSDRYLWQVNAVDQLMADEHVTNPQSPGNVVWPLANQQGTINDLASYDSETGITAIANHRVYDSYGNLKSQTNAAVDCLFGFTGRAFDEATGSQYNTTRWYDPKVGHWESEDWIGFAAGDTNTSRYCGNSPTNATDPSGLDDEPNGSAGSFFGTLWAGWCGIGKALTSPGRLIPGTTRFWAERDAALQHVYDKSNIGGTGWQTMSEYGSDGAAIVLSAGSAGALARKSVVKAAATEAAAAEAVATKTIVKGLGNIGSHSTMDAGKALSAAEKWLGRGYTEIGPRGSGVFRSADGLRQFRMTAGDLDVLGHGTKSGLGSHVHFEALDYAGRIIENLHIPVTP